MHTLFGWVIMGRIDTQYQPSIFTAHISIDLNVQLQQFWETEELPQNTKFLSDDEKEAESHFQKTVQKLENGRYMVRLPFKAKIIELGDSKECALKRLYAMERRLANKPLLKEEYVKFMREYIALNHMEVDKTTDTVPGYFMPHHAIVKPTSTTTKLRVVFDASCQSSNGKSLNDQLLVGPTIQNDLFTILLKFRMHKIGITADIEKMYRQILIHPKDRRFQRILWRESIDDPIVEYCLNTVTYGTAAAPFLAIRTLHQISVDIAEIKPMVSDVIKSQFYVDDFMSSFENTESAIQLKNEVCSVLCKAGLNLRKWSSNSREFLQTINPVDRAILPDTIIESTQTVKTLGLLWDTVGDSFKYSVDLPAMANVVTKRNVLSDIAKIFDPIGLLAPVVIGLKIFMQRLWLHGIDWDQALPVNFRNQWITLRMDVDRICDLRVPRWIGFKLGSIIELHGFADSSEMAYAAVVYLKITYEDGRICTSLITAKTRVAPVKQITLPRLELCAAHLLVKLMIKVQQALNIEKCKLFGWSDSKVVLAWISDHPRRWKSFIANRTSYIIDNMPSHQWSHISTKNNPADLATRGIPAAELVNNSMWWSGPDELRRVHEIRDSFPSVPVGVDMEETREVMCYTTSKEITIFDLYSDYTRLIRITALIRRFMLNCKGQKDKRNSGFLTSEELLNANLVLIKLAQQQSYSSEIRILSSERQLSTKHKLSCRAPFIDQFGLMRVGGRIESAMVSENQKHPFILEKNHPLTNMLVKYYHLKYLHAGRRQMLYLIGLTYWIPSVTCTIKRCIYKCITCMRYRGISYEQQMGNLPKHRIQQTAAFVNTGVDFAGPINIRSWKGRGSRLYKSWIAVFVCMGTKAIHLELVTELSSAAFLAALRRFVSRRGRPLHIYSDNGTNFVGCSQQLREMYQLLNQNEFQHNIQREMCDQQINWHFSPPSAPHFGGIWEAAVKSTKFHLKRVLANASATFEEMSTILCQVELCLNSRPLCIRFEGDTDPLTPAHFLILRAPEAVIDEDLSNKTIGYCTRWQYVQKLVQELWKKWSREYLTQLQQRPKWSQKLNNLKIDDIVIVKDNNLPPTQWSIAKVTETHPGADGLVRVVTVKTSKGFYKRPIAKLCPLFLDI